jgi:hypothetical protein
VSGGDRPGRVCGSVYGYSEGQSMRVAGRDREFVVRDRARGGDREGKKKGGGDREGKTKGGGDRACSWGG